VIVNQAFVEKYLGKENPLGKQFGQEEANANHPRSPGYEIIGVVRDAKYNSLRREIHAMMYIPQSAGGASFELRTAADPQAILPAIREVVAQVNTNLPLFDVKTESEQIDRLLFQERLVARLAGFFGLLALVLACVGLYGLLSYEVSQRTREIGIRLALGAHPGSVLKLVFAPGNYAGDCRSRRGHRCGAGCNALSDLDALRRPRQRSDHYDWRRGTAHDRGARCMLHSGSPRDAR